MQAGAKTCTAPSSKPLPFLLAGSRNGNGIRSGVRGGSAARIDVGGGCRNGDNCASGERLGKMEHSHETLGDVIAAHSRARGIDRIIVGIEDGNIEGGGIGLNIEISLGRYGASEIQRDIGALSSVKLGDVGTSCILDGHFKAAHGLRDCGDGSALGSCEQNGGHERGHGIAQRSYSSTSDCWVACGRAWWRCS